MSHPELADPNELLRRLTHSFVSIGRAFHVGHPLYPGEIDSDVARAKAILLRHSVLYRFESLVFHYQMICQRHSALLRRSESGVLLGNPRDVVYFGSRDLKFLFDDIVFNIVSLFDYFGTLIGLIFHPARSDFKWSSARSFAAYKEPPFAANAERVQSRLHNTEVGLAIIELNTRWLKGIAEYRNALIHGRSDVAKGEVTWSFASGEKFNSTVNVAVPDAFTKYASSICYADAGNPPQLLEVSASLISLTYVDCTTLIEALSRYLEDGLAKRG